MARVWRDVGPAIDLAHLLVPLLAVERDDEPIGRRSTEGICASNCDLHRRESNGVPFDPWTRSIAGSGSPPVPPEAPPDDVIATPAALLPTQGSSVPRVTRSIWAAGSSQPIGGLQNCESLELLPPAELIEGRNRVWNRYCVSSLAGGLDKSNSLESPPRLRDESSPEEWTVIAAANREHVEHPRVVPVVHGGISVTVAAELPALQRPEVPQQTISNVIAPRLRMQLPAARRIS